MWMPAALTTPSSRPNVAIAAATAACTASSSETSQASGRMVSDEA
jgi:hypothetical protein